MKIFLILIFIHKLCAYPHGDLVFPDSKASSDFHQIYSNFRANFPSTTLKPVIEPTVVSEPAIVSESTVESEILDKRFDDSADDIALDLSTLFNDTNIVKSENDTNKFEIDETPDINLQYGDLYQGDIELTEEQKKFLNTSFDDIIDIVLAEDQNEFMNTTINNIETRVGLLNAFYRWPKDRYGSVIVPYQTSHVYSSNQRQSILGAMADIEQHTCIKFKPRSDHHDYIYIESGKDCSSHLGRIGKRQRVSLNKNGCISRGTILHALFHVLGFDHMQNHMDRDNYINIEWKNIKDDKIEQFLKVDSRYYGDFNTEYDFYSVTHYSPTAFSKNGKRTITTKNYKYRNIIGQLPRLSNGDITRLNNMYKCKKY